MIEDAACPSTSCPLCPCVPAAPAVVPLQQQLPFSLNTAGRCREGNVTLCTAIAGDPISLGTDFHLERGPVSFFLALKRQEEMGHWSSYMDVGCLCLLVHSSVLPATSMGGGGEKSWDCGVFCSQTALTFM